MFSCRHVLSTKPRLNFKKTILTVGDCLTLYTIFVSCKFKHKYSILYLKLLSSFNVQRAPFDNLCSAPVNKYAGMYFASTMAMVSIALVMAVIVTNIYAKKNSPERCPVWAVRVASKFFPSNYLPERQLSSVSLSSTLCGDKELASTWSGAVSTSASHDRLSRVRRAHDADSSTNGRSLQQAANRRGGYQPRSTSGGGVVSEWNDHVGRTGTAERRAKRMQRSAASSSCESSVGGQAGEESGDATLEKYEKTRAKAEWTLVALFADRFFLWVFTGLSLTVHISLIVQMQPRDS